MMKDCVVLTQSFIFRYLLETIKPLPVKIINYEKRINSALHAGRFSRSSSK